MNPFEHPDPASLLAATHKGFLGADELALLREQVFPGDDPALQGLTLGQAVRSFIETGAAPAGVEMWLDSLEIEVKPRSGMVNIDVTDGSPVATLYQVKGFSHLAPWIRQLAGYIEFDESRVPGDVRVIVAFPL